MKGNIESRLFSWHKTWMRMGHLVEGKMQGGHFSGKPGKVRELKSGQGKVREDRKNQGK